MAGCCHQKYEGNQFKTKEFEWVILQHSNKKPYLFTGITERGRNQPNLMKPESKRTESDQHSSRSVGEAGMPVIHLALIAQNRSNMGLKNALNLVVLKGGNPAHCGT